MASPQVENGFIRISTELFKALRAVRIPGEARQVLDCIIEKTYGWHKKEDVISLSQFEGMTGINKPHVSRAITKLVAMQIITQKGNGKYITYGVQKNYKRWKPLPKKVTLPKKATADTKKGNETRPKKATTKDSTKDTITKDKRQHLDFVFLTDEELKKLKERWPQSYRDKIKKLNDYAHINPKKFKVYQDHYRVILKWNEGQPAEIPDRPISDEKPQKRDLLKTSPEIVEIQAEMMRNVKGRPEGWVKTNEKLKIRIDKLCKDLNTRSLGDLIKEGK